VRTITMCAIVFNCASVGVLPAPPRRKRVSSNSDRQHAVIINRFIHHRRFHVRRNADRGVVRSSTVRRCLANDPVRKTLIRTNGWRVDFTLARFGQLNSVEKRNRPTLSESVLIAHATDFRVLARPSRDAFRTRFHVCRSRNTKVP